ncbi:hypothetical protein [Streptomyces qinglanensis]|uniref:hypothetical protein n=1 Tax=Streptomyces qinglanensis TaxID=943816 RepID=UPI003D71F7FC
MSDDAPRESVGAGYEDVAAHFRQHQPEAQHRQSRRARTSFGPPAFLVPSADGGRRVSCCTCLRGS